MGFRQIGNLIAHSRQLAAFLVGIDRITIRVSRVLSYFRIIPGTECSLPEICGQKKIPVAGVFTQAHSFLFLCYQECLFLL